MTAQLRHTVAVVSTPDRQGQVVLVTGCSSGIGRATALRLLQDGHVVYASARKVESLEELAAAGCETLALDVADEESRSAAVRAVEERHGAVGVLVNNAGYSQSGALETLPLDLLRAQLETNVVGLLRMCQLVLPGDARPAPGRDREHRLDGRPPRVSRRRRLPRVEVRRRGALRRAPLRGRRLRRGCRPASSRA